MLIRNEGERRFLKYTYIGMLQSRTSPLAGFRSKFSLAGAIREITDRFISRYIPSDGNLTIPLSGKNLCFSERGEYGSLREVVGTIIGNRMESRGWHVHQNTYRHLDPYPKPVEQGGRLAVYNSNTLFVTSDLDAYRILAQLHAESVKLWALNREMKEEE